MDKDKSEPKIGAGHASAMFRQGLAELRAALYPESNVIQPTQPGIYGTRTQGEVMQERGTYGRDSGGDEPHSVVQDRLRDPEERHPGQEPERSGPERE